MIKYFCDRCGKETKNNAKVVQKEVARGGRFNSVMFVFDSGILCEKCAEKFDAIKDKLKHEEDIFNMTEAEILLLRCSFKSGDKVITADGRTGTITSICKCDSCAKRGFYEPTIKMDDGSTEYIMISDKEDGFKSYYQIGDGVFGNLDEESVIKELEEIGERYNKLIKQQGMIHLLRYKKEYNNGN